MQRTLASFNRSFGIELEMKFESVLVKYVWRIDETACSRTWKPVILLCDTFGALSINSLGMRIETNRAAPSSRMQNGPYRTRTMYRKCRQIYLYIPWLYYIANELTYITLICFTRNALNMCCVITTGHNRVYYYICVYTAIIRLAELLQFFFLIFFPRDSLSMCVRSS